MYLYAPKDSTGVKTLGANMSSVTFPEFSPTVGKTKREMNLPREIFDEFTRGKLLLPR